MLLTSFVHVLQIGGKKRVLFHASVFLDLVQYCLDSLCLVSRVFGMKRPLNVHENPVASFFDGDTLCLGVLGFAELLVVHKRLS